MEFCKNFLLGRGVPDPDFFGFGMPWRAVISGALSEQSGCFSEKLYRGFCFQMDAGISDSNAIQKIPERIWYSVWTLARNEKKMQAFFQGENIPCYLPLCPHLIRNSVPSGSEKKGTYVYHRKVYVPMFPGYLFAALDAETKHSLKYNRSVIDVLDRDVSQEELLIRDLNAVRMIERESESHELTIRPDIAAGTRCILHGKFEGWHGVVRKRKDLFQVVVALTELNFTATLTYDILDVETIV